MRIHLVLLYFIAAAASAQDGVILLHGLARSGSSMEKLEQALQEAGYVVLNVDYPSRTAPIAELATQSIRPALDDPRLAACERVHFISHSMGGILLRSYVAQTDIPRLGRVVMLGPPNQGSEVVDRLRHWRAFQWLNGPAGSELGTEAESVPNRLGPVLFELGVIAGRRSINWINSLMIPGADDGKVSVERTKVEGMKEHLVLPVTHPLMMKDEAVIAACLNFLAYGSFAPEKPDSESGTEP
jgi:triacylglycerol lipase